MLADTNDLIRALNRGEFVPHFQPIVELLTGRLAGFEVLARWQHPKHKAILPENFIELAEESGNISRLMELVFARAFESAPMLPDPLILAVNVSPCQLQDMTLPGQIQALAKRGGFPMERLHIEITESALVNNIDRARTITRELKSMGCRLAMDDFGTGYSSLRHLKALSFDKLKVDQSFVAAMMEERESRKIVATILGLGHSLGLVTVGEGIETEAQAQMMQLLGCDLGQGYLYGRPAPAESIPAMIAAAPRDLSTRLTKWENGDAVTSLEALPMQRLAQLKAIYDGAPVGMCFLSKDLRYVSLNQRLAEINGVPVGDHIGRTVKEVLPSLYAAFEPYFIRALAGEAIADIEISKPVAGKRGSMQTGLVSYQPAFDEVGEVVGISITVVDITERKRAEDRLRNSEDQYRHMVELNPHIPWVLDAAGNVIDFSSRWTQLTGFSREQTYMSGWLDALNADDKEVVIAAVRLAVETGKPIDVKYRVRCVDGRWKWMRSRGAARYGESGEVVCWYGILEDIDEYIRFEESLRQFRSNCVTCEHFPGAV